MSVRDTDINGDVKKSGSGNIGFIDSTIAGLAPLEDNEQNVTYVNTSVGGEIYNTTTGKQAMVNGVTYNTLEKAVSEANPGDTVVLLNDVVLNGTDKQNNDGLLTINKSIILDGNGKTITAENVTVDPDGKGPSMINIQNTENVTIRDLTIDGAVQNNPTTKHGLNIYDSDNVTVENVMIRNNRWYAAVVNGSELTVNDLTTEKNQWGINVDNTFDDEGASLVIKDANIEEDASIVIEKTVSKPKAKIENGQFQYIVNKADLTKESLTISGGKFATGEYEEAVDISDYLAPGLIWSSNGAVVKKPSSSGGGGGSVTTYAITVEDSENGQVEANRTSASRGSSITLTVTPDEGYELSSLTVTDADGNEIEVTENDGTYRFTDAVVESNRNGGIRRIFGESGNAGGTGHDRTAVYRCGLHRLVLRCGRVCL